MEAALQHVQAFLDNMFGTGLNVVDVFGVVCMMIVCVGIGIQMGPTTRIIMAVFFFSFILDATAIFQMRNTDMTNWVEIRDNICIRKADLVAKTPELGTLCKRTLVDIDRPRWVFLKDNIVSQISYVTSFATDFYIQCFLAFAFYVVVDRWVKYRSKRESNKEKIEERKQIFDIFRSMSGKSIADHPTTPITTTLQSLEEVD